MSEGVLIGALLCAALLLGIWTGHVLTFRTGYFFYHRERDDEP